jgi:DNA-binding IclR family transcriptional regulator
MDWVCESLLDHLRRDGRDHGVNISCLVNSSGYARQTVHNHLKHLTTSGLVLREVVKHGRGRPEILYRVSRQAYRMSEEVAVVSLAFERLRHACRFEKGGWCKKVRGGCVPGDCPFTLTT